ECTCSSRPPAAAPPSCRAGPRRNGAPHRDCARAAWCADISCPTSDCPSRRRHTMIAPDVTTAIDRLRQLVEEASVIVPFTGAGISTECGIPDFRSPGGIWTKMRPIDFSDFLASQDARDESWRRRFAMQGQFGGAKPGRGHQALASLYKAGKSPGVV